MPKHPNQGNILLAITNGIWMIDRFKAMQLGPVIQKVLNGDSVFLEMGEHGPKVYSQSKDGGIQFGAADTTPFSNSTAGSVAVISITGPIMKYDTCFESGTKTYESLIQSAYSNPNIAGIVLVIDSPGGTVDGTESLSNILANRNKPVVTLADGCMCSAAYWIGSTSDFIYVNDNTTDIGSIGTMCSFADVQKYYEALGVVFHELYADASTDKNKAYNDARQGNYELIKKDLNDLNNIFLSAVQQNRAGKINLKQENVLTGKTYLTADAIKYGLADAIGQLPDAIDMAFQLAESSAYSKNTQTKNANMKNITAFVAISAYLASVGKPVAAEQTALTEDQLTALENGLNERASFKEAHRNAEDKVNVLTEDLRKEKEAGTTKDQTIAELNAKVTELGQKSAGATGSQKNGADNTDAEKTQGEEFLTSVDKELADRRQSEQ